MYFAYVDETGIDGNSPCLVMVGIVVDSQRLRRTQDEFGRIFDGLDAITTKTLKEVKSNDLLAGNGPWRGVPGEQRREVVSRLCGWLVERKHTLALAAIVHEQFRDNPPGAKELNDPWLAGACHIALQIQRVHQAKKNGKGRTVLVFDDNRVGMPSFVDLIASPPAWTDDFYDPPRRAPRLDQLIDTPFAVQSHQVGLIQVADVFAAVMRRHAELLDFSASERYPDERAHIAGWVEQIAPRLLARASRWPRRSKAESCADWYCNLAPPSLKALGS